MFALDLSVDCRKKSSMIEVGSGVEKMKSGSGSLVGVDVRVGVGVLVRTIVGVNDDTEVIV